MKNVIVFDTSIGSMNKGDEIIMKSCYQHIENVFKNQYVAIFPTHTPSFTFIQQFFNPRASFVKNSSYKFICGTNLIYTNMMKRLRLWNIGFSNCIPHKNSILMGVGSWGGNKIGIITKLLYKFVLSHEYTHSTRDEKTKQLLEKIGVKALNTGCPTLWNLTPDFCSSIPTSKADKVVITLNGTHASKQQDQSIISTVNALYKEKFIWIQSPFDLDYFRKFSDTDEFTVIPPSIAEFSNFLNTNEVDYVGTRLHAGIFAMQHRKRALIFAIDSRASEMNKTNNLNCLTYDEINNLKDVLEGDIITDVRLDLKAIQEWKNQFIGTLE